MRTSERVKGRKLISTIVITLIKYEDKREKKLFFIVKSWSDERNTVFYTFNT